MPSATPASPPTSPPTSVSLMENQKPDALNADEQRLLGQIDDLCGKVFDLCEPHGKLRHRANRDRVRSGCQQLMHNLARLGSELEHR